MKDYERLTKRVGCNEAILVSNIDFCRPYIKAGACKTGVKVHSDGRYGYQRHCNDECALGTIVDRLAEYEDTGLLPSAITDLQRENAELTAKVAQYEAENAKLRKECGRLIDLAGNWKEAADEYHIELNRLLDAARWVPVTERLPEIRDKYSIQNFNVRCLIGQQSYVRPMQWVSEQLRGKRVGRWKDEGRLPIWEITHWRPLPKFEQEVMG